MTAATPPQGLAKIGDSSDIHYTPAQLVASLFLNPKYSDLSIKCGAETFAAHRNIVCSQSIYFETACDGRFKEGNGEITLHERDPTLVRKTLEFLYSGDYSVKPASAAAAAAVLFQPTPSSSNFGAASSFSPPALGTPSSRTFGFGAPQEAPAFGAPLNAALWAPSVGSPMRPAPAGRAAEAPFHAQMYAEGDFFQIQRLKDRALDYFEQTFMDRPSRQSYAAAVTEAYTSTPSRDRALRTLVVQLTADNLKTLRTTVEPIFDDKLLCDLPSFTLDICRAAVNKCAESQMRQPTPMFRTL